MKFILPSLLVTLFGSLSALAADYSCTSLTRPDLGGHSLETMKVTTNEAEATGAISIHTTKNTIHFPDLEFGLESVEGEKIAFLTGAEISLTVELSPPFRAVLNPVRIEGKQYLNLPFVCSLRE